MKRILLTGLLAFAATAVGYAPAEAAACSGSSGVTVVVQFPDGHTETGCAPGDPGSGLDALSGAGFTYTFVPGQNGAVCTIKGAPEANCWGGAYWAYFHAARGGSWSYAGTGGAGYDPKPGTVEGWRFGRGTAPSVKPPGSAPTPTAKPTKAPTRNPTKSPTRKPATATTKAGSGSATSATASPTARPSATASTSPGTSATKVAEPIESTEPSQTPSSTSTTSASAAGATGQDATADEPDQGISWVWGLLLVGALAAAGGATAVLRRRG